MLDILPYRADYYPVLGQIMREMDVNFAGVDVMISKDFSVYVIELNTFPSFPKVSRFNLSKRIIQRIEDRKWN